MANSVESVKPYNLTESSFAHTVPKGHRFHQPNTRLGQSKKELWFLIRGNWQMPWCILCIRYKNISIYFTHIGLLVSSDVSCRLWFQRCFLMFMFYPWRFGEMMRFDLRIFVQSGWTQTTNHIQYIHSYSKMPLYIQTHSLSWLPVMFLCRKSGRTWGLASKVLYIRTVWKVVSLNQ